MLCDGCPRAFHMACLDVALGDLPEAEWTCPKVPATLPYPCQFAALFCLRPSGHAWLSWQVPGVHLRTVPYHTVTPVLSCSARVLRPPDFQLSMTKVPLEHAPYSRVTWWCAYCARSAWSGSSWLCGGWWARSSAGAGPLSGAPCRLQCPAPLTLRMHIRSTPVKPFHTLAYL